VKSVYYVRDDPVSLFKQYFNYGFWRAAVLKKHKIPISFRQLVPVTFILLVIIFFVIGMLLDVVWILYGLPAIYIGILLIFGAKTLIKFGFRVGVFIPLSIAILHLSYAFGTFSGLIYFNYLQRKI